MHKCAGTTVVTKAIRAGFTPPPGHRNGNLMTDRGKSRKLSGITRDEFDRLLTNLRSEHVDFFGLERDFVPIEYFPKDTFLLTVLRDPFDRVRSNFRFNKLQGLGRPDMTFREYCAAGAEHRRPHPRQRPNFFVRMLAAVDMSTDVTQAHLGQALQVLKRFNFVAILGVHDLDVELGRIGMAGAEVRRKHRQSIASTEALSADALIVSEEDRVWFEAQNSLDVQLIEQLRATRPSALSENRRTEKLLRRREKFVAASKLKEIYE
jgi:hypothetical protein